MTRQKTRLKGWARWFFETPEAIMEDYPKVRDWAILKTTKVLEWANDQLITIIHTPHRAYNYLSDIATITLNWLQSFEEEDENED